MQDTTNHAPAPSSRVATALPALRATYRVQMNAGFTLRHLRDAVPYLDRLGVSHVYCSPLLAAKSGSMHGYDVTDPTRLNAELGDMDDLRALAKDLHARGMGLLLDIVPNHMSASAENPYWMDVLARGEHARFAHWFDIDWSAPGADHKVVLPVLGDALEHVIERGELRVVIDAASGASVELAYFDARFPLRPDALPAQLQVAQWDPESLDAAQPAHTTDADLADTVLVKRSARVGAERLLSGAELRELIEKQHYRLLQWRDGVVNYRRFFDVNALVALRMEDPRVFDATHGTVLEWIREGLVDGLRVDHVDGLRDPLAYLTRLRAAVDAAAAVRGAAAGAMPIFVEKILGEGEMLRGDWPVQGTTGYEFLNDVEDLFVDPDGFAQVERCYRIMRRLPDADGFATIARDSKRRVLETGLAGDLARVARSAAGDPVLADSGARAATSNDAPSASGDALAEFVVSLPVYRTYIDAATIDGPSAEDCHVLRAAGASATTATARTIAERIASPPAWETLAAESRETHLAFVERVQQLSGPVAARGVEDTALYVYVPLASRNEVGGAPDRDLTRAVERFHANNGTRAAGWPANLLCTDTHDTKRGADVRARLDAVSECASEWHRCVQRWRRLNARHRVAVKGRLAPDTNAEYLLYQTLVGLWPAPRQGRRVDDLPDAAWRDAIRPRVNEYMLKAVREAKRCTSWTDPDAEYEAALAAFVDAVLQPGDDAPFLPDLARFVARIADASFWIGAARTLLHMTVPGTPDIYQGTELASAQLVDPDNRRPVDFAARAAALDAYAAVAAPRPLDLAASDAQAHLRLVAALLAARRADPDLFARGSYRPLTAEGARRGNVVGFLRQHESRCALIVAPRLLGAQAHAPRDAGWWADTRLMVPPQARDAIARAQWSDALAGRAASLTLGALGEVPIASLFSNVPLALFTGR
jgi:(1->4)-alpha-D-glucan 1-alpha-D-glucosylmutase